MPVAECHLAALLPALRRGVPIVEIKAAARATAADPQCIQALLDLLIQPSGFSLIQRQKAAWILHHAFQLDERAFLPLRAELGRHSTPMKTLRPCASCCKYWPVRCGPMQKPKRNVQMLSNWPWGFCTLRMFPSPCTTRRCRRSSHALNALKSSEEP